MAAGTSAEYLALARKYRPQTFEQVVGQEHVLRALRNSITAGRLHHAYLLTGTRGIGKTTLARILAKALECQQGVSFNPCGKCAACRGIAEGSFPDVVEIDAASESKVEETRSLLENTQYPPMYGRYKVYIIDEVHMLSVASFNALLKTLEAPPAYVKFILATTEVHKILTTVLSRCLKFQLRLLSTEEIAARITAIAAQEQTACPAEAALLIARAAKGSMRDALSLCDQAIALGAGQISTAQVLEMLGTLSDDLLEQLLGVLRGGGGAEAARLLNAIARLAPNYRNLLDTLAVAFHDLSLFQMIGGSQLEVFTLPQPLLERYAACFSPEELQLGYQIVLCGLSEYAWAPDGRIAFEMTYLRLLAFAPQPADRLQSLQSAPHLQDSPAAEAAHDLPAPAQPAASPAKLRPGKSHSPPRSPGQAPLTQPPAQDNARAPALPPAGRSAPAAAQPQAAPEVLPQPPGAAGGPARPAAEQVRRSAPRPPPAARLTLELIAETGDYLQFLHQQCAELGKSPPPRADPDQPASDFVPAPPEQMPLRDRDHVSGQEPGTAAPEPEAESLPAAQAYPDFEAGDAEEALSEVPQWVREEIPYGEPEDCGAVYFAEDAEPEEIAGGPALPLPSPPRPAAPLPSQAQDETRPSALPGSGSAAEHALNGAGAALPGAAAPGPRTPPQQGGGAPPVPSPPEPALSLQMPAPQPPPRPDGASEAGGGSAQPEAGIPGGRGHLQSARLQAEDAERVGPEDFLPQVAEQSDYLRLIWATGLRPESRDYSALLHSEIGVDRQHPRQAVITLEQSFATLAADAAWRAKITQCLDKAIGAGEFRGLSRPLQISFEVSPVLPQGSPQALACQAYLQAVDRQRQQLGKLKGFNDILEDFDEDLSRLDLELLRHR